MLVMRANQDFLNPSVFEECRAEKHSEFRHEARCLDRRSRRTVGSNLPFIVANRERL
jgi:hypothetical protein